MLDKILPLVYPAINKYHIILANGEFPRHYYFIRFMLNAQSIICCDGAANKLLAHSIEPNYIIGDCDSLNSTIKKKYADRIIMIAEQSNNDLTKALSFTMDIPGVKQVIILGATGLREDHTIGNIAILAQYLDKFTAISMISDYGIFTAHNSKSVLLTLPGQQISFFSLDPDNTLNCNELKWPLLNLKLSNWNNGTLNEATHNSLTLSVTHPTIVYRSFEIRTQAL